MTMNSHGPIPARAGQPPMSSMISASSMAYPRACGATLSGCMAVAWPQGLSPRVRGNRSRSADPGRPIWPIPARAGQPPMRTMHATASRAYPRACGATDSAYQSSAGSYGLSPRVRGNPMVSLPSLSWAGPIPARAGQPACARALPRAAGAYPRACGATAHGHQPFQLRHGLSPRVRGNLGAAEFGEGQVRPIPARAGQPPACAPR